MSLHRSTDLVDQRLHRVQSAWHNCGMHAEPRRLGCSDGTDSRHDRARQTGPQRSLYSALARNIPQTADLRGAGKGDDIHSTGGDALDQIGDALIVDIGGINVWCHRVSGCACSSQEVHQRKVRLITIELNADRSPGEIERGQGGDDALRGRLRGLQVGSEPHLSERADRLRSAGNLSDATESFDERVLQLDTLREPEEAPQAFPGEQDQIVACSRDEASQPRLDWLWIVSIEDGDEGTADHSGATLLEELCQHVELTGFWNGDGLAGQFRHGSCWFLGVLPSSASPAM